MGYDFHMKIQHLIDKYKLPELTMVTKPTMPPLQDFQKQLELIWESQWLTNNGPFHREFEQRLSKYLGVEQISLFCNGTIALLVALQALRINSGEVITTPFTFPATAHVLYWNGIRPTFCDIDPVTFNLDPQKIEKLISPDTKAILAVHIFGNCCDMEMIKTISEKHGLYVIYDAAHAFGVSYNGRSIVENGDITMLSFHATKLFSTFEGGALVAKTEARTKRINFLKNFGIADEETVIGPGINGKMNELQAAYGLLQLEMIDAEITNRSKLTSIYCEELSEVPGITLPYGRPDVKSNYSYFPILIDSDLYGMTRNEVYNILKKFNIMTRKYFYPLCSHYPWYSALPSARSENLPVAERVSNQVLCLPLYGNLSKETTLNICKIINELHLVGRRL